MEGAIYYYAENGAIGSEVLQSTTCGHVIIPNKGDIAFYNKGRYEVRTISWHLHDRPTVYVYAYEVPVT